MFNSELFNSSGFNSEQTSSGESTPANQYNATPFNFGPFNGAGSSGSGGGAPSGITVAAIADDSFIVSYSTGIHRDSYQILAENIDIPESLGAGTFGILSENTTFTVSSIHAWGFGRQASESILISYSLSHQMAILAAEMINIPVQFSGEQTLYPKLVEEVTFQAKVGIAQIGLLNEIANISASGLGAKYFIALAVEHLIISNTASGYADAAAILAEAIITSDSLANFFLGELADSLTLSQAVMADASIVAQAIEVLLVTETVNNLAIISVDYSDQITLNSNLSLHQILSTTLTEQATFYIQLPIDDDVYDGWVMNTVTHAVSEYTNFPFNSYCEFNGKSLAASTSGLFSLGGDLDGTANISASFSSGVSDFGTSQLKRAERVYLGYRADGLMALKVTTGESVERWYELHASDTENGIHEARIKLGKGVKSRYWQFELVNKAGSDFEIDSFEFVEIAINRKVRR